MNIPFSEQDWRATPPSVQNYIRCVFQEDQKNKSFKQNLIQNLKKRYWPDSNFVGPFEKTGHVICVCEDQWLWEHRNFIRGVVLDMSTPKYWHSYVYDLPNVSQVLISDLDSDIVEKSGVASKVDVVGDFCATPPPMPYESVDTVLCISILEHCEDPVAMIRNLANILRADGYLLCACPFAYIDGHMYPDYWRFCRDGYVFMAQKAGLEVVDTGQFVELGKYAAFEFGEDYSANSWHRGIPSGNWMIARKATTRASF